MYSLEIFPRQLCNHRKRHQPHSMIVSGRQMSIYASMMSIFLVAITKNCQNECSDSLHFPSFSLFFSHRTAYLCYKFLWILCFIRAHMIETTHWSTIFISICLYPCGKRSIYIAKPVSYTHLTLPTIA